METITINPQVAAAAAVVILGIAILYAADRSEDRFVQQPPRVRQDMLERTSSLHGVVALVAAQLIALIALVRGSRGD